MKTAIIITTLFVGSAAVAQSPPQNDKSFFRADGQPTDKVLLKASEACHKHNPSPADAKVNCAVVDDQIAKRQTK
jgi:hypothetical protein